MYVEIIHGLVDYLAYRCSNHGVLQLFYKSYISIYLIGSTVA